MPAEDTLMIVAIIPARGGSKRIPRKNIKHFAGKPMISYPIRMAIKTELFDRIIVSTDDEEIAGIAHRYGAETPFMRPKALADDITDTDAVVRHAIEWLNTNEGPVRYACCIYATTPFIQSRYIREGFLKLENSNESFAFAVTSFPFPIKRALKISKDKVEMFWPEHYRTRSQDLEAAFHDAGQFYWGRANAFLSGVELFSERSIPVVLPRYFAQDIDTPEDWSFAEIMFQVLNKMGKLPDYESLEV